MRKKDDRRENGMLGDTTGTADERNRLNENYSQSFKRIEQY